MNIIGQAKTYLYIYTPYLIPSHGMSQALRQAAERGVAIKLILPGIPDKKIINLLTKAHYQTLLDTNIEIYEYTPGFIHAKSFVADDEVAAVGSINLDYRSLYHSFESGCLFFYSSVVADVRKDFELTLKECVKVEGKKTKLHLLSGIFYAVLRILSPLL